jgi:hypothetical protein
VPNEYRGKAARNLSAAGRTVAESAVLIGRKKAAVRISLSDSGPTLLQPEHQMAFNPEMLILKAISIKRYQGTDLS